MNIKPSNIISVSSKKYQVESTITDYQTSNTHAETSAQTLKHQTPKH